MSFWKDLGKGLAIGAGVGAGFAVTNHVFNGYDRAFSYPSYQDYLGYGGYQFQRMSDFTAGRVYQAQIDRQMLAMNYGLIPWGCF